MRWDSERHVYLDDRNLQLTPEEMRAQVEAYVEKEKLEVAARAALLLAGAWTLAAFFAYLGRKVRLWHQVTGGMAYGEDALDAERWLRVDAEIEEQLRYLAEFKEIAERSFSASSAIAAAAVQKIAPELGSRAVKSVGADLATALLATPPSKVETVVQETIEASLASVLRDEERASELAALAIESEFDDELVDDLAGGRLGPRASSYADAAYGTFVNNFTAMMFDEGIEYGRWICEEDEASCENEGSCIEQADLGRMPLSSFPPIGSRKCLGNCRCYIEPDLGGPRHPLTGRFV